MNEIELPEQNTSIKRGRGRPRKDESQLPLTRDSIAVEALKIIGSEGFAALSMSRLAAAFGATPRALYNYVNDRQEVMNLAVAKFLESTPMLRFDVGNWQETVRVFYQASRALYREYPWIAVVPVTERVVVDGGPRYVEMMERLLQFYTDLGLSLPQALSLVRAFIREIKAFALQDDYYKDRVPDGQIPVISQLVPEYWLDEAAAQNSPLVRQTLDFPIQGNDALFEELLEMRIFTIQAMLDELPEAD
ncbi:TetR/AcrR family transcriptional regulator [Glutamicibacter sp. NPDC087344]|uniref:TetR/AcrR family transcriptional regulator n=1 Tax=Glutamicibacter sp. NPDC087344 TaxID=3363994 RepID=UPI0038231DA5